MTGSRAARRVALNAVANYLRFGVTLVVMLLLTPAVVESLGAERYGLWVLIVSVVSYVELMDCGLATAAVKFVGQYEGAEDIEGRNQLVSTLLAAYLTLAALVLLAAAAAGGMLAGSVDGSLRGTAVVTFAVLTGKAALELPLSLFLGVLFGRQRICLIAVIRSVFTAVYGLGAWWVLTRGGGLISFAWVHASASLVEHATLVVVCFRTTPGLRLHWRLVRPSLLREVATFSSFALVINLSSTALLRTDPIVIQLFLPLSYVAVYAVAMRIADMLLMLTKQGLNAITPLLAQLHGAGKERQIARTLIYSTKYGAAAMLALAVPAACWAEDSLAWWLGPAFRSAGPLLSVLAAAMVVRIVQEAGTNVLAMTGGHRFVAAACLGSAVLNVVLSLALVPFWGLPGVAAATFVSALATAVVVAGRCCRRHGVAAATYWREALAPVLRAAVLQLGVCLILKRGWAADGWPSLALLHAAGAFALLLAFGAFALTEQERLAVVRWRRSWLSPSSTVSSPLEGETR